MSKGFGCNRCNIGGGLPFYLCMLRITNTIDWRTKSSVILVGIEVAVLLFNKWTCPLTPLAKKYTSNRNPNFDIYLPEWLAKHNKFIFGAIFVVGMGLVGWRVGMEF